MAKRLTPKAKKALAASIKKWARIVEGTGIDMGGANCALCKAYPGEGCIGCPVRNATGFDECRETPYRDFLIAADWDGERRVAKSEEAIIAAAKMVAFLRSIAP